MEVKNIVLTFIGLLVQIIGFGQTPEIEYFYHSEYFSNGLIVEKKVKNISIVWYWTRPNGKIYKENKTIYKFDNLGQLLCSESYYFEEDDPEIITQQTIDCFEYDNGLNFRHLRYHNNKDSAEWIQKYEYTFDSNRNITKVIEKDLTHPHNSNITEKFYDSENRIITEKTDYGYLTEYRYDSNGNLVERIWGPKDGSRYRNSYLYDSAGKLIEYERTPSETYETVKEFNKYDNQGKIFLKELVDTENTKSQIKYFYEGQNTIRMEFINQTGEVYSTTTKNFLNGLIQSEITVANGMIHSKEIFEYEFY